MIEEREVGWIIDELGLERKQIQDETVVKDEIQLLVMSVGILHVLWSTSTWIGTHSILVLNTG